MSISTLMTKAFITVIALFIKKFTCQRMPFKLLSLIVSPNSHRAHMEGNQFPNPLV